MKKVLAFLAAMFMVVTGFSQIGLGLGYNVGTQGQGFSLDFEFISGRHQLGFEGDFLLKDRFELTVHGGPRFEISKKATLTPCLELGYRSPKSPIFGGSILGTYNPYKQICLFLKLQYGTAVDVDIEGRQVTLSSPGDFKAFAGLLFLIPVY